MHRSAPMLVLFAAVALAGCSKKAPTNQTLDTLDKELVGGNDADPALTAALEQQIMVDPTMADKSNRDAVRPADKPTRSAVPLDRGGGKGAAAPGSEVPARLMRTPAPTRSVARSGATTLGARAAEQARRGGASACTGAVRYSATYADRLPAEFPVYPRARVAEAAGNDAPGCGMRVVSFSTDASPQSVLDYYYTRARQAGFSAEHVLEDSDHVLAGTRADDAYYLVVTERRGGGTDADLIANNGR